MLTKIVMYVQYMNRLVSCVVLPSYNQNWNVSTNLNKNTKCRFSWQICPVGAKLFHVDRETGRQTVRRTDGPTEMTKLTFRRQVLLYAQAVVSPWVALVFMHIVTML